MNLASRIKARSPGSKTTDWPASPTPNNLRQSRKRP